MKFEETLRNRINEFPYGSLERNTFKLVLGELQQKSEDSEEVAYSIIKKMINSNLEVISMVDANGVPRLKEDDPRREQCILENKILSTLLPSYLTESQIKEILEKAEIDVKSEINEGKAIGKAMQHLKSISAQFEGKTVKNVVAEMRK